MTMKVQAFKCRSIRENARHDAHKNANEFIFKTERPKWARTVEMNKSIFHPHLPVSEGISSRNYSILKGAWVTVINLRLLSMEFRRALLQEGLHAFGKVRRPACCPLCQPL